MQCFVETLIKIGEEFLPVDEVEGCLPDDDYIEGAIVCRINDAQILGMEHCDMVDQLWAYIVVGLSDVQQGKVFETYFPDHALRLVIKPLSPQIAEVWVGQQQNLVDRQLLVRILAAGAESFFTAIRRIVPGAADTWDRYLNIARALKV